MPLARLHAPFDHPDWLFELNYDGFRALAYLSHGRCELISRKGNVTSPSPQPSEASVLRWSARRFSMARYRLVARRTRWYCGLPATSSYSWAERERGHRRHRHALLGSARFPSCPYKWAIPTIEAICMRTKAGRYPGSILPDQPRLHTTPHMGLLTWETRAE
jgi:hypothetical protein